MSIALPRNVPLNLVGAGSSALRYSRALTLDFKAGIALFLFTTLVYDQIMLLIRAICAFGGLVQEISTCIIARTPWNLANININSCMLIQFPLPFKFFFRPGEDVYCDIATFISFSNPCDHTVSSVIDVTHQRNLISRFLL